MECLVVDSARLAWSAEDDKGPLSSVRPVLPHEGVGPPAAGLGRIRWSPAGVGTHGEQVAPVALTPPQTPQRSLHPADAPGRSSARRPLRQRNHQAGEAVAVDEHDLFVLVLRGAIGGLTAEGLHRRAPHALLLLQLGLM